MRQLGYTRVSTSSQDAQLQLDALVAGGVQKRNVFADVTSGSKTAIERPGMKKLLEYAEEGDTEDGWISIGDAADRPAVALQRVDRLVRPQWPDGDHPQQMHVDVLVEDLDAAESEVRRLGATSLNAGTPRFRVYTDPSGHPFCLVQSQESALQAAVHDLG